ncbi:response regulator transcription factor [Rhodococcus qingshengii]|nr:MULTISPECIES: LuxR family transcriptional regulator [Rhodococcus]AKD98731.1 LuxR family transcriptional regulator [Rhodococcus erythropolis]ATI32180.1 LuxR family transcriptional regulator [Rhodococcus sp. H-CA8f]EME25573.1 LuxR family transcriptional regulator [Rhodococcus qingshengii BKS 20-40]KLN70755.1 LuxR family transcriptional regulator [Rhodococcus erythropolis]KPH15420.1 LuxR family transcriptional regulator [Rhodococcus sp. ADH]
MTSVLPDRGAGPDMFAPRSPAAGAYGILGLCAEELRARGLAYSAAAVTYRDPSSGRHRALASSGYDARVLEFLLDDFVADRNLFGIIREASGVPVFWQDVPRFEQVEMVTDVLRPSGYAEGASVALGFSGREVTGLLHMSFADSGVVDRVREVVAASSAACSRVVGDQVALDRVHLSPREIQVLQLVARGAGNVEIAEELFVSRRTVATHLENIFVKTGTNSRVQAAVRAAKWGLIES